MYYTALVLGYTNLIAGIIGIARYSRINYTYRPFIYLLWAGILADTVSHISNWLYGSNIITTNIYTLLESLLVIWLFRAWDVAGTRKNFYSILVVVSILVWCTDNLLLHRLSHFNGIFRIYYSFVILYLALYEINQLLLENKIREWKNAKLIICVAFVIYFTFKALLELFYLDDRILTDLHKVYLFYIMIFINAFTNLIYAAGMLCIPRKQNFITCHW